MSERSYLMKAIDDFVDEPACRIDVVLRDEIEYVVQVGIGRISDDQLFRRDRSSPRDMMSAFIVSASGDLRYSPRW